MSEPGLQMLFESEGIHLGTNLISLKGTYIASDERIKTDKSNILLIEGLQNVLKLSGKTYNYIDEWYDTNTKKPDAKNRGFLAQEVQEILPNSVKEDIFNHPSLGKIEDFKILRKEDIIVETVVALQYMVYFSIYQIGYDLITTKNEMADSLLQCLEDPDQLLEERALCMCNTLKDECTKFNRDICSFVSPWYIQCKNVF